MWRGVFAALLALIAAPLLAQAAPYKNLDGNGVDLTDGTYNFSLVEGSAGSGDAAVSLVRIWSGSQFFDNWSGRTLNLTTVGSNVSAVVNMGATYDSFQYTGGAWVSRKRDGGTLTEVNSSYYIYRDSAGNIIDFMAPIEDMGGTSNLCNSVTTTNCTLLANSIIQTNGRTVGIGWAINANCTMPPNPDDPSNCIYSWRFGGADNGHFGFYITYASDSVTPGTNPGPSWYQQTNATFTGGATVTYSYPSTGVTQVTTAAGRVWRFTVSGGKLTGIKRPASASADTTTIAYSGGTVSSVTNNGVTTGYARTVSGSTATMVTTDANSNHMTVVSDMTLYRPISVTDQLSRATSITYDSYARPLETTAPEGNKVVVVYDARGNVTSTTLKPKPGSGLSDIVTTANFPSSCANPVTCNRPEYTIDARGNRTDYTYSGTTGQTLAVTLPAPTTGAVRPETRYLYTTVSGISYLAGTSVCRTTASCVGTADEVVTAISYNASTLPASTSAGAGDGSLTATTSFTYDAVGNQTYVDGPLPGTDDTTRTLYNADREVIGVIGPDPDGAGSLKNRATRITINLDGQPTFVEQGTTVGQSDTAWAGFTSLQSRFYDYDSNGRLNRQTQWAAGTDYAVSDYLYDALGRRYCSVQYMNPAVWGPQASSCAPLQTTGPFGPDRVSKTSYDAASQVIKTTSAVGISGTEADDATLTYTNNGKMQTLVDANGNKTTYEYDGFDRLDKQRYPSPTTPGTSSTTDYIQPTYDAASNVTSQRLRDGVTVAYGYDDLNRLILKDLPNGSWWHTDYSYGYDLLGRLTTAGHVGSSLVYGFTYDALGRTTGQTSAWYTYGNLAFQYDLAGRRTRESWADGFYVTYDHLVTGETTAIRENGATTGVGVLGTYAYDDLGRRTTLTRGNGTSTSYGYDPTSRLTSLAHDLAGTGADVTFGYGYNPASQIVSRTRSNDGYAYALANQDLTETPNGLNQLTAQGGTSLTYDGRGNVSTIGSSSYAYTSENQLWSAPAGAYAYNPLGGLFYEVLYSGSSAIFSYEGAEISTEHDAATGGVVRRYVRGPGTDEVLTWYEGSGTTDRRWLYQDERNSTIAIADASGSATTINKYDDYGIPASGNVGRFQYTGQAWLPELGMHYYKARIYAPGLGRFMQTDPIGYSGGMNLYAYVGGDPINATDSTGLSQFIEDMTEAQSHLLEWEGARNPLITHSNDWMGNLATPGPDGRIDEARARRAALADATYRTNQFLNSLDAALRKGGASLSLNLSDAAGSMPSRPTFPSLPNLKATTFFGHFLDGTGSSVSLTSAQFQIVVNLGREVSTVRSAAFDGYAQLRTYYGTSLENTFGSATIYLDRNFNPIGFHDKYDFDRKSRSFKAQILTAIGAGFDIFTPAKVFEIYYP